MLSILPRIQPIVAKGYGVAEIPRSLCVVDPGEKQRP